VVELAGQAIFAILVKQILAKMVALQITSVVALEVVRLPVSKLLQVARQPRQHPNIAIINLVIGACQTLAAVTSSRVVLRMFTAVRILT